MPKIKKEQARFLLYIFFLLLIVLGAMALNAYLTRRGPRVAADAVHYLMGAMTIRDEHVYGRYVGDGSIVPLTGFPYKLSRTPANVHHPPPTLGEHNHEILADLLGYSPEQIAEFEESGVI